ncbi:MAG: hypothetical protein ACI8PT_001509 [Gammaproteobacteria bacterium]|jgi:hypothetical protein
MEHDTERAGGLEPLRLLPKGNKCVLPGLITIKRGELEAVDGLRRRFDEASKYVDIGQLGISPQCGFVSTEERYPIDRGRPKTQFGARFEDRRCDLGWRCRVICVRAFWYNGLVYRGGYDSE